MTKKVLLIPNMPHWSVDKCAHDLVKYNKSNLQLDIVYYEEFLKNRHRYCEEYDLLYPMVNLVFLEFLKRDIPTDKMITAVLSFTSMGKGKTLPPGYDMKPPGGHIRQLKKALLVNTICKKFWYVLSEYLRVVDTKYTCDLELFYPDKKPRTTDKLVVGWTGSLTNNGDVRGIEDILEPACREVKGIELKIQCVERNEWITDDDRMREYYNSLDLYVCASKNEGTPRSAMEAAACGVPVLSTDVGIMPEVIENGIHGYIIERSIPAFVEKLEYFAANRYALSEMGRRIRQRMEHDFNWRDIIWQWTDYFNYALELYRLREEGLV